MVTKIQTRSASSIRDDVQLELKFDRKIGSKDIATRNVHHAKWEILAQPPVQSPSDEMPPKLMKATTRTD